MYSKDCVPCSVIMCFYVGNKQTHTTHTHRSLGLQECAASFSQCDNCADTHLFTSHQQQLCSDNGETQLVRAISRGTLESIRDCQRQFSNSQWNCTTFKGDYLFGSFVENG